MLYSLNSLSYNSILEWHATVCLLVCTFILYFMYNDKTEINNKYTAISLCTCIDKDLAFIR